jgi:hypothetical protein
MPKYQLADSRRRLKGEEPGDATRFVSPFEVQSGQRFRLFVRVSSPNERKDLPRFVARLKAMVKQRGGVVTGKRAFVESVIGFDPEDGLFVALPLELRRQALKAKRRGEILLAYDLSRFLRHPSFVFNARPDLRPRLRDLEELRDWTEGCRLMTVLHPNAPLSVLQSKRSKGHKWIDRREGWVKRRRERLQTLVRALRKKRSLREIQQELRDFYGENLSPETIRQWCR